MKSILPKNYLLEFIRPKGQILFLFISLLSIQSRSQDFHNRKGWEIQNPFDNKSFIENKGQFKPELNKFVGDIKFATKCSGVNIYFSNSGLCYEHTSFKISKEKKLFKSKKEQEEEYDGGREDIRTKEIANFLFIEWVHANKNVELISEEKTIDYFTYSDDKKQSTIKANAYKKIIYKNLYEGIDLEYSFPKGKEGIKYTLIVHAGADISKIKMKYHGDKSLQFDLNKNIRIESTIGNLIDHKPFTYLADEPSTELNSSFLISGHEVSFDISSYDHNKTLIIDPWVVNPSFPSNNKAYDIEKDGLGNIYVYGGQSPYLLKKFTSNGTPIWTYTSTFTGWYGDLAVEPLGNAYITEGYDATNNHPNFAKINSSGAALFNVQGPAGQLEYWCLNFNCGFSQLTVSGGTGSGKISDLDVNSGAVSLTTNTTLPESRGMSKAPNGNYYCLTQGSNLMSLSPTFTTNFAISSGYSLPYSIPSYNTSYSTTDGGYNCIFASTNYVYTTNGLTVDKWDNSTGAAIATAPIPGGIATSSGGVQVDNCGNVYIGGVNAVYKFDSNLVALTSYPTSSAVYGLCLGTSTGEVIACGDGFIASVDSLNTCISSPFGNLVLQATAYCPDSAMVKIVNANASVGYTFIWEDSATGVVLQNVLQPIGVDSNTASGLTAGIPYKVTVIQSTTCQVFTNTIYLTINCSSTPITINRCPGDSYTLSNGTIISTPGVYLDTLTNSQGLDSVVTITFTNYPTSSTSINGSICQGQSYTLPNGSSTNVSGVFIDTFVNMYGCDSIIIANVIVHPNYTNTANASICSNQTYTLPNGIITSIAGTYIDTFQSVFGCDSFITTHLTIKQTSTKSVNATICSNQNYTLPNGINVSAAGVYVTTLVNSVGCDSIITTTLQVKATSGSNINGIICQGELYILPDGSSTSTAGTTVFTFTNAQGCDSFVSVNLVVKPSSSSSQQATICSNDSYILHNGTTTNSAGTYYDTIPNGNSVGCDSIIIETLNVVQLPTLFLGNDTTICKWESITLDATYNQNNPTYLWNDQTTNPIKTIDSKGTYSVGISIPPCPTIYDEIKIAVTDCNCKIFIPNAFSPNGDLKNDVFKPFFNCTIPTNDYKFSVYDRWGNELFTTSLIEEGWDGTYKLITSEMGTYFYLISYKNPITNQMEVYKGDVTLVR